MAKTPYDLEHVTVTPRLDGKMYMIEADEGFCILIPGNITENSDGSVSILYKRVVILNASHNWDEVQILSISDLPEDAEIMGIPSSPQEKE